ncbi:MAG: hypothetical protein DRO87_05045 [Candidatus Thorarchaeota archaeon]|nr:MAG: hypothetical protein DRP09_11825 [Candidatus Thorarchaeota archaeon]RLI58684.1 MAG: hypothetical protein DRO87_05045 [Candidatus Thorarchaeota archaeon]
MRTFFGRNSNVDPRIGGEYEVFFNPKAKRGEKGAEGLKVFSCLPQQMLSFEWGRLMRGPLRDPSSSFYLFRFSLMAA